MADSHDAIGLPALLDGTNARLAVAFLRMFEPNGPWWIVAIDPVNQQVTVRRFRDSDQLRQYIAAASGRTNLYHIANPHSGNLQKPPNKGQMTGARCLFADIDLPADEPQTPENLQRLLDRVNDLHPPASPIVFSGGGFNAYWLFPKTIYSVNEPDIIDRTEAANKQIAASLGSDHVWNINRILRLPYTINIPTKAKLEKGRVPKASFIMQSTVKSSEEDNAGY